MSAKTLLLHAGISPACPWTPNGSLVGRPAFWQGRERAGTLPALGAVCYAVGMEAFLLTLATNVLILLLCSTAAWFWRRLCPVSP
jgi:hypothetical protein